MYYCAPELKFRDLALSWMNGGRRTKVKVLREDHNLIDRTSHHGAVDDRSTGNTKNPMSGI